MSHKKKTYCGMHIPVGLNLNSAQGHRWTKLVSFYADRLGEERIRNDEVTRALFTSLIAITLRSEQVVQDVALGKPADDLLRLSAQMNTLLVKLGLTPSQEKQEKPEKEREKPSEEPRPLAQPATSLASFLAARKAGAP